MFYLRYRCAAPLLFTLLCCWPASLHAEENQIDWVYGPSVAIIGDIAEIRVPKGYQYTGKRGTQLIMELTENPVSGAELGTLMRTDEDSQWFVVFEFDKIGYVKDDDRDKLNAKQMLKSIKRGNDAANRERRRHGWATLDIEGWEQEPKYNKHTNNLEWAIRASSEGTPVVNYNTRILGRTGVMEVSLVIDPADLSSCLHEYKNLMTGFRYGPGNTYAEFRAGDHVAEIGLAALVTGGAAAVALKSGLLPKLGKLIVVAAVGVGAFIKKLLGFGDDSETSCDEMPA